MRITRRLCIFLCVTGLILIFIVFLFDHFGYSRQHGQEYPFPESGTWYCQELGITLFLDEGKCVICDGKDTITCSMLRERGSREVYIHCYEFNNSDYEFEHLFFSGDFLNINGDVFYIQEHKSKTVYTFTKSIE